MWFLLLAGLGVYGLSRLSGRTRAVAGGALPDGFANPDYPQALVATLRPDGYPTGIGTIYNGPWYFNLGPTYYVDLGPSSLWLFYDDGQAATREALQSTPYGMGILTVDERLPGMIELGHHVGDKFYVLPASFQPPVTQGYVQGARVGADSPAGMGIKDGRGYGPYGNGYIRDRFGRDVPLDPDGNALPPEYDFQKNLDGNYMPPRRPKLWLPQLGPDPDPDPEVFGITPANASSERSWVLARPRDR